MVQNEYIEINIKLVGWPIGDRYKTLFLFKGQRNKETEKKNDKPTRTGKTRENSTAQKILEEGKKVYEHAFTVTDLVGLKKVNSEPQRKFGNDRITNEVKLVVKSRVTMYKVS